MVSAAKYPDDYLEARGISGPEAIANALDRVLSSMEPLAYEAPTDGLTTAEQDALREGGLRLERTPRRDLVAEGTVRFAALVQQSLSAEEVAKQLNVTPGRVHQLMSSRELYSFRLDGRRLVPEFQIHNGALIPNIAEVNEVLPATMHPLGIFNFYHRDNIDLVIDEEQEVMLSPLAWLAEGRDPDAVRSIAQHL